MSDATLTSSFAPVIRRLPDRAVELFGRDQDVADLADAFESRRADQFGAQSGGTPRMVALTGPAGVGKTQIALAYANQMEADCRIVWWIDALDPRNAVTGLMELARELNLADPEVVSFAEARKRLFQHLANRDDWLIVFDGLDNLESARGLWPLHRSGRVLVTSRNPNWNELGLAMPIRPLQRSASIELLKARSNRHEDDAIAGKLASALGDLPLALDQAAALIRHNRTSFADYLQRFETHWAELLSAGRPSPQYPLSLSMSWDLSFRAVEAASSEAAGLLSMIAMLHPGQLPRTMLGDLSRFAPPPYDSGLSSPVVRDSAVATLIEYGLIDADSTYLNLQPIGMALAKARLDDAQRTVFTSAAADAMRSIFVFEDRHRVDWSQLAALLPHALAAAGNADRDESAPVSVRMIYNHVGLYLMTLRRYAEARSVLERALAIARQLWGSESPRLSPIANNLGRTLLRLNDPAAAYAHFDDAVRLDETSYGSGHSHVAESINNRGIALYAMGEINAAAVDFDRALEIINYTDTLPGRRAHILNNVGYAMLSRGDHAAASARLGEAFASAREELGEVHPTVASVLRNLGATRVAEGDFAGAVDIYERSMLIDQQTLGHTHPKLAQDYSGLADAYEGLQDWTQACNAMEKAVAIETAAGTSKAMLHEHFRRLIHLATKLRDGDAMAAYTRRLSALGATDN